MKKLILNYVPICIMALGMLFIVSCGDDEEPIIDPGTDGINVADGLYLRAGTADPVSSAALTSEVVEAEGFASMERTGFNAGFMWLEAGDYEVVSIADKEIAATIGGSVEMVTDDGSSCDHNDYMVVTTEEGGPAFSVGTAGLYRVTHDAMTSELVLHNVKDASIIGSSTENGWAADTPLTGSVTSDGGSWSASGVVLRSGQWKMRYNCRWSINRRIDPNGTLDDPANGYQSFTNFGGTVEDLVAGGVNFEQTEDGEYTITADWSPQNGWTLDAERTGDAPTIAFNPNDFQMGVIGSATADEWNTDRNLFHKEDSGVHSWYGVVTFVDGAEYKFRANDEWNFDLGGDLTGLATGGANLVSPGAGAYYIVLTTADEGMTWSASVDPMGWAIIGEGGPSADWGVDAPMDALGFVDKITSYSATGTFTDGEWKFRAGGDWAHNLGGDVSFLNIDGGNLTTGAAGDYTVTLNFDGEVYSATIQ